MIDFVLGVVVGATFAPFWIGLWNTYLHPLVSKLWAKITGKPAA